MSRIVTRHLQSNLWRFAKESEKEYEIMELDFGSVVSENLLFLREG